MMLRASCLVGFGFALTIFGCGEEARTNVGPASAAAAGMDAFLGSFCDAVRAPCCAQSDRGYDRSACVASIRALGVGSSYDSASADACLARARTEQSASGFCYTGLTPATKKLCLDVIDGAPTGTKAPGADCEHTSDCAPSSEGKVRCVTTSFETTESAPPTETRTCEVDVLASEGADCEGTLGDDGEGDAKPLPGGAPGRHVLCARERGLFCDGETKQCTRVEAAGGPCDAASSHGCTKDSYCDWKKNACVARKSAGAPCSSARECLDGHYCDSTTLRCTLEGEVGAACERLEQCAGFASCTDGVCHDEPNLEFCAAR